MLSEAAAGSAVGPWDGQPAGARAQSRRNRVFRRAPRSLRRGARRGGVTPPALRARFCALNTATGQCAGPWGCALPRWPCKGSGQGPCFRCLPQGCSARPSPGTWVRSGRRPGARAGLLGEVPARVCAGAGASFRAEPKGCRPRGSASRKASAPCLLLGLSCLMPCDSVRYRVTGTRTG
jgi:hypothetical protein